MRPQKYYHSMYWSSEWKKPLREHLSFQTICITPNNCICIILHKPYTLQMHTIKRKNISSYSWKGQLSEILYYRLGKCENNYILTAASTPKTSTFKRRTLFWATKVYDKNLPASGLYTVCINDYSLSHAFCAYGTLKNKLHYVEKRVIKVVLLFFLCISS